MRIFKRSSIATELSLWFLIVALLPLGVISYVTYRSSEKALTEQVTSGLSAIGQRQANQIEAYLRERERSVTALSHSAAVGQAMERLAEAFKTQGARSEGFGAAEKRFRLFARQYQESSGYEDLYLISLQGDVVFSANRRGDFGSNLKTGAYRDSELARVFEWAAMLIVTELSDFAYYAPAGKPVAFIATPLFKDRYLIGVAAFQLSNEEIYRVVNDYTGLGESGETVIASKVGEEAVFITPTRHDPEAAFNRKVRVGSGPGSPIQEAVRGRKGSGLAVDYRGEQVLAIWKYLPYLRWGMMVKIDTREAFGPIARLRMLSYVIGFATLIPVVLAAVFVARSLSNPIIRLTEMTRSIAGGDLDQSVHVSARNEIRQLAASFNVMTQRLKDSMVDLQAKNTELATALESLRESRQRVQLLEQVKSELSKFVPDAVRVLLDRDPGATELEKKNVEVSVLFLDIAGYARLSEQLEPKRLNQLIQLYFSSFLEIIRAHHGDVNETAGDGLMVIFQPDPRGTDHALNAVRAAIRISQRVGGLNEEYGGVFPPVQLHMGINTGEALVGATKLGAAEGQRWTFTASGPTTNVAARLAGSGAAGEIVAGPVTAGRIREHVVLEALGAKTFKNVSEPVEIYRVIQPGVYPKLRD